VVRGLQAARKRGLRTLALTGRDGGTMAGLADICLKVPSQETPRIQEVHITVGHILCDLVDFLLFPDKFERS
jgi:D-sedoheptulose 7-phosphate isomerase